MEQPKPDHQQTARNGHTLQVANLTRTYQTLSGPLTVLHDVSFSLKQGSSCALLGPSGSGKTTLLSLCAGLDLPSSGSVRLLGHPLDQLDEEARARLRGEFVGFVFQSFRLFPTLTAIENVMVPLELRGVKEASEAARDLLAQVGLADRVSHYPGQLSGGEQQRVAIARAFINRPQILFADEPTGNLDASTSQRVVDLLFELNHDHGTTLVLVTHDPDLAQRASTQIRLRQGQLVSSSSSSGATP